MDGLADPRWEAANLVSIPVPYRMVLAWDPSRELRSIRCHKRVAPSLARILQSIKDHYKTQQAIEAARMHLFGGCYMFRPMRGLAQLSIHSYGAAIDLDPANNPLGKPWRPNAGMMPEAVIKIFQAEGWVWGDDWDTDSRTDDTTRHDAMHFQAAIV